MKKFILSFLCLVVTYCSFAQTISRKVIASAGSSYEGADLQVGYTVGETFITTIANGNLMLTQGFQQPEPCDADFQLNNGSDTITYCGQSYVLQADQGYTAYQWNSGDTGRSITITQTGWYSCSVNKGPCVGTDSVLVILNANSSSNNIASSCDSYSWNGNVYTQSGTYTYTSINAAGCDSLAILSLTINYPTHNITTEFACNNFSWNGTTYTSSGTYTYAYTNNNGCASVDTLYLTINTPIVVTINATPILCNGGSSTITVSATGGISPYNGTGTFTQPAGTYNYTITDSKGCIRTEGITITEPTTISVVTSSTPAYRGADGTATATAYGGTAPYNYSWNTSPAQTTATATALASGTYTVTVTDVNGCTKQASVIVQSSGTVDCPTAFKTYGQGAWGAPANGNNAGTYLNAHFASAYPTGLKIGDCGRYIILTSATAVRNFLPSGSTPRQLNAGTLTNPTRQSYSNVFAGHLVSLNLNITLDSADAAFGSSTTLLKNTTIKNGMFTGWTVQQLYNEANRVIGCGASSTYINALKDAVEMINGSWEGGQKSNDYLNCPAGGSFSNDNPITDIKDVKNIKDNVVAYPNPTSNNTSIKYTMSAPGTAVFTLYNAQGKQINTFSNKHAASGDYTINIPLRSKGLSAGVYTVSINRNGVVENVRVVVE